MPVGMKCPYCFVISSMGKGNHNSFSSDYKLYYYRLAYPIYILKQIIMKYQGSDIIIMYDIACTLRKHLMVSSYNSAIPGGFH